MIRSTIDFAAILAAPSWEHWCGTDAYGRDIFSRIIYGSRTALVIGFTSSFLGSTIGAVLGVASAYFGGKIDDWIQRFVDILLAFPIIVLALVVVAALRKFVHRRHRREPDLRHRDPDRPARRARGARRRALGPRHALCRRGARGGLFATAASSSATWRRTWSRPISSCSPPSSRRRSCSRPRSPSSASASPSRPPPGA